VTELHANLATIHTAPDLHEAFTAVGDEAGDVPPEVFATFVRA
jgi:hypothetical protein